MKRLQRLEFPENTREALQYVVSTLAAQDSPAIPGLSGGPEAVVGEICQAFVLFRTSRGVKVVFFIAIINFRTDFYFLGFTDF